MNDLNIINLLNTGIKAETLRQKAIASNVANLNTPNYRRIDVQFEEILDKAMKTGDDVQAEDISPELFSPMNTPVQSNGNDVEMDMEIGEMVKNSLKHKAYTMLLQKKYQQYNEAMKL